MTTNNNSQDELIPRPQAARLLREMFPQADSSSIASACWRAFFDERETCSRAELVEALKFYQPRRDFRLRK